jgi:hypothetical protein
MGQRSRPDCPGIRTTEGKVRGIDKIQKTLLNSKVILLEEEILYLTVCNNNNNNNNNNILKNYLSGKY